MGRFSWIMWARLQCTHVYPSQRQRGINYTYRRRYRGDGAAVGVVQPQPAIPEPLEAGAARHRSRSEPLEGAQFCQHLGLGVVVVALLLEHWPPQLSGDTSVLPHVLSAVLVCSRSHRNVNQCPAFILQDYYWCLLIGRRQAHEGGCIPGGTLRHGCSPDYST